MSPHFQLKGKVGIGSHGNAPALVGALPPISMSGRKGGHAGVRNNEAQARAARKNNYQLGHGFSKSKVKQSVYLHYYPNAKAQKRRNKDHGMSKSRHQKESSYGECGARDAFCVCLFCY